MIRALLPISKLFSLTRLVKLSGLHCFFPFYHTVGFKRELPHINKLYEIRTPEEFEHELDFLLTIFNPINPQDLIQGDFPKPGMLLSFDDGLRGVKEFAHPILQKKGVPYILFVNPAFIDNKDLMFRCKQSLLINHLVKSGLGDLLVDSEELSLGNYSRNDNALDSLAEKVDFSFDEFLRNDQPYLTKQELIELKEQGVYIGAHSMDHPLYENLEFNEQVAQTEFSIDWVKEEIGCDIDLFSFPFTDHGVSKDFMNRLHSNEKEQLTFGSAGLKFNTYSRHFQRLSLEEDYEDLGEFLKSKYVSFQAKKILGRDKVIYR